MTVSQASIYDGCSIESENDFFLQNFSKSWGNFHFWWLVALTLTTVQYSKPLWTISEKNDLSLLDTGCFIMTMPDNMLQTLSFRFWKVKAFSVSPHLQPISSTVWLLFLPYSIRQLWGQHLQITDAAAEAAEERSLCISEERESSAG